MYKITFLVQSYFIISSLWPLRGLRPRLAPSSSLSLSHSLRLYFMGTDRRLLMPCHTFL